MCYDYERLESLRKEMEKQEELKKQQSKARTPAKQAAPDKGVEQEEPVPA
jgi:hypothetical protein